MNAFMSSRIAVLGVAICFIAPGMLHAEIKGTIKADGSSTVYPITEAVAEEFGAANRGVQVTVGVSGTGGGFKKFIAGETDISNASRPVKSAELDGAKVNNVEMIEIPVAFDALSVVVNPKNTWVKSLTVAQLRKMWEPAAQGKINNWNQIDPSFPDKPLSLYGAGIDSGTYDYFTEAIMGKEDSSRGDYTASEDDNVLVQGVSRDEGALGFFGLAYYLENKDKLRSVPIDDEKQENGAGPQAATLDNVKAGIYQPLARPLFIYVRKDAASRPEVDAFVKFYLQNAPTLAAEVGYIPLPANVYTLALQRYTDRVAGTLFQGHSQVGVSLENLLAKR